MSTFAAYFLAFVGVFVGILLVYHLLTKKFVSPYTLTVVFGPKGVGKSCSMQKDHRKHHERGWHCFADSNTNLPFVKRIDARKIYQYKFPPNSFITIDEVNLLWDNRDFKSFPTEVQKFFREQRKHNVKIICYSQTFDCDKKLRDLADRLAIQKKRLRVWTTRNYYVKTPRVISAKEARDTSKIVDDYVKIPFFFGGKDICYMPKYIRDYDTNEIHGEVKKGEPKVKAS